MRQSLSFYSSRHLHKLGFRRVFTWKEAILVSRLACWLSFKFVQFLNCRLFSVFFDCLSNTVSDKVNWKLGTKVWFKQLEYHLETAQYLLGLVCP